jgi:exopolysaccharide production protein ExoQ
MLVLGGQLMRKPMPSDSQPRVSGQSGMLAATFLVLALALGGGGSPEPLPEMILEGLAALFAGLWMLGTLGAPHWRQVPRSAWIIAGIVAGLPLLQLIPLPPFAWQALPGRAIEVDALGLIGEQSSWRTLALAPARTLASLLSLGPPLLLLVMTSALEENSRLALIRSIALMAVATLVLGAVQHAAADGSVLLLYSETGGALFGFQANNNSTADFLLVALITGPLLVRGLAERRQIPNRPATVLSIAGIFMALCAFGVVLTSSRMGIALLPIPVLASFWILRPWIRFTRRTYLATLVAALVALPICFVLAQTNPVLARVVARFDSENFAHEVRPQLWRDGLFTAQKYFPFGVGMGDFVPAYIADERLEVIGQDITNRAHNDLIELTVEAGLLGLAALSAVCFMLVRDVQRSLRDATKLSAGLIWFAGTALGILALHSMVDYPFRSLSLASLGGVCVGLLLARRRVDGPTYTDHVHSQSAGPPDE